MWTFPLFATQPDPGFAGYHVGRLWLLVHMMACTASAAFLGVEGNHIRVSIPSNREQMRNCTGSNTIVGINKPQIFPACALQAQVARGSNAAIGIVRMCEHNHARIAGRPLGEQLTAAVGRAIVDRDHLDVEAVLGAYAIEAGIEVGLGIKHRDDDADSGIGMRHDYCGRAVCVRHCTGQVQSALLASGLEQGRCCSALLNPLQLSDDRSSGCARHLRLQCRHIQEQHVFSL